jgi:hypothetical protein
MIADPYSGEGKELVGMGGMGEVVGGVRLEGNRLKQNYGWVSSS